MTSPHESARPIRVLVAYLSPLVTTGVVVSLGSQRAFHAQPGTFDALPDPAEQACAEPFDVVITGKEHALRLAQAMRGQAAPRMIRHARIFVINQGSGELDLRGALELGILGYAAATLTHEQLQDGVRTVARGLRYVCPHTARFLADLMTRESLTARETEVLGQLARGMDNKTIAQELGMAIGTVKAHIKALMSKLDARSRTQVVTIAIARGLVVPGAGESAAPGAFSCDAEAVTHSPLRFAA
ncbi:response regulator transcription factor [Herbaspirillum sp. LeCh32-8]|uniref:response regulator transcription factor n=1 Tax=Herbaspirillum sp. LeCh32-8 TaxID=2821356 RepID=UPI001AE4AE8C|nr:response regulator transcription factor [Herbaspirillum sp. LeCh32-8]MBP0600741.1 response regulator transcription factor [Herbaspirillum sp. LeCh32-8]